jgi:hypothetical protein
MKREQRRPRNLIVAYRRGRFAGPFPLLIRAPDICEHAAKRGEHLGHVAIPIAFPNVRSSPPPAF